MIYSPFIVLVALLSLVLTAGLRRYALARKLIDIPSSRSSHVIPTPRGGGVAIVFAFLFASVVMFALDLISMPIFLALFFSGLLVATLGFVDDHGHVSVRWRLLGHFAAASWALFCLGGVRLFRSLGFLLNPGTFVELLLFFIWYG